MTVKLNRWGWIFSRAAKWRYLFWGITWASLIYNAVQTQNASWVEALILVALTLAIEAGTLMYLPIRSFQIYDGIIEYYDKIDVVPGKGTKYEKMGFLLKDIKSIEINQGIIEKLFGFAHIEIDCQAEAASEFDRYRLPNRNKHRFYGVQNAEDVYAELLKFFPSDIVKDNTTWR